MTVNDRTLNFIRLGFNIHLWAALSRDCMTPHDRERKTASDKPWLILLPAAIYSAKARGRSSSGLLDLRCINCLRILPRLEYLREISKNRLTVIGVPLPKFNAYEKQ